MPLSPLPPVTSAANIVDDRLQFPWDEWQVRTYFAFDDDAFLERLLEISGRGSMALTMAIGEWVCRRFAQVTPDPEPWHFLEAAWAAQMQSGRCKYTEIVEDHWRGPARGPMAIVITIANDAIFCLDEDPIPANRAVWMTNLARHVLPEHDAFEKWLAQVIDLLARYHPKTGSENESLPDDDYALGRPVARELFDTTKPYQPTDEARLIARFLQSVDPSNPYLSANEPDLG
jgi:hypothetical protein